MKQISDIQVELSCTHMSYLQRIAVLHYGSLDAQYEDMIRKFIQMSPWTAWPPLEFRTPPNRLEPEVIVERPNLTSDIRECIADSIQGINSINQRTLEFKEITESIFIYTAIVWWTTYVYPQHPYDSHKH